MEIEPYFYKIFVVDEGLKNPRFRGTSFPVAPDGGMLTCRHVLDVSLKDGQSLAILDNEKKALVPIKDYKLPANSKFDVAFIPNALGREKKEYFPILTPSVVRIGEDIYSFGYFESSGGLNSGYFKGNIVNFVGSERNLSTSLSYAVIEGLSGSPVLTYHNGPKVLGMCHGNIQTRVVASEVLEYEDEKEKFREVVNRIVELGQAHHASSLISFLSEIKVNGYVVSESRVVVPKLENQ